MITATFNYESDNCVSYEISGHAYADEPGRDLVCAAVSAVAFGLTNAIIRLSLTEPEIKTADGYIRVSRVESDKKVQTIVYGLLTSLETIEEDYSKYLKIIKN